MTKEKAIETLVQQDVDKWGESERSASQRLHGKRTIGLAINELANRAELAGTPSRELRKLAKQKLTHDDWAWLRSGG